ncbi:HpcH/HpaI aldolase/citrate lyase family protein [Corynebacterium pseudotuberculosis]|uniref:CoA ester lyase n=1 Tax=Corynebacterium pseudotuberculosis (strain C231) TaxID=681645 RepID=D9QAQ7_CORP2|nr:CoA ester lyase [Corynebacterium pseudotuberculosis]ADK28954.1 CoA ester lyase [Corynebacterium pseudotuberculosis FRC41]ADL10633.1 CoA ester lyase [Corynebacterium pseudotuberculosis C231]ADL21042.1 CoA ester lyase [Corynebacterium pseudotuberculosis 1002]ADO26432.1 CoA ester lyase [Corynebacterium pseudotuberculosis I19]AEK92495.1 Citrate lyase subunit beta-like protein [Corynebacterium pseudotuberculosis PAT10]
MTLPQSVSSVTATEGSFGQTSWTSDRPGHRTTTAGYSALFCPADRPDRAAKALASKAHLVILDLEDAVAPSNKDSARERLRELIILNPKRKGIVVRINSLDSAYGTEDLATVRSIVEAHEDIDLSVMLPKTSMQNLPPAGESPVPIIALIESAQGLKDLEDVAAHPNVVRLALGAFDLSVELGCNNPSVPINYARAQLVLVSALYQLFPPLESPCSDFHDETVMEEAAIKAARDGFGGSLCIHPAQIEAIHKAFMPSESEIEWAKRVVAVGDSAVQVDGKMVDRPVVLRARRILEIVDRS